MASVKGEYDSASLFKQAQNIWTMLDEMATSNPEAYRKFIDKQIKEGQSTIEAPQPHMSIRTKLQSPYKDDLYINFCSWNRVPAPKSPDEAVPVVGVAVEKMEESFESYRLTSVAFNPETLKNYGRDSANAKDTDTLINLAMDFIEDQQKVKICRRYKILGRDLPHKGCLKHIQGSFLKMGSKDKQFEKDLQNLKQTFGSACGKDSLLEQLANISVSQSDSSAPTTNQPEIKMPFDEKTTSKTKLIQEIGSDVLPEPIYDTESVVQKGKSCVLLKISLPGVSSVEQCDLEISQDDISLEVPSMYKLYVKLPVLVSEETATAKFNKKLSVLSVTMPHLV